MHSVPQEGKGRKGETDVGEGMGSVNSNWRFGENTQHSKRGRVGGREGGRGRGRERGREGRREGGRGRREGERTCVKEEILTQVH